MGKVGFQSRTWRRGNVVDINRVGHSASIWLPSSAYQMKIPLKDEFFPLSPGTSISSSSGVGNWHESMQIWTWYFLATGLTWDWHWAVKMKWDLFYYYWARDLLLFAGLKTKHTKCRLAKVILLLQGVRLPKEVKLRIREWETNIKMVFESWHQALLEVRSSFELFKSTKQKFPFNI